MTTVTPARIRTRSGRRVESRGLQLDARRPPLFHDGGVPVDSEPLHDRGGDRRAYPVHDGEGIRRSGRDRVDRAEGLGQRPGRGRPHVPDGQRDQDPPQRPGLRLVQVGEQGVRDQLEAAGLVHEERAGRQLLIGQVEQVALVGHEAVAEQRDDRLVAECLDVKRAAGGEVEEPLAELCRARDRIRAPPVDLSLVPPEHGAAFRALAGELELPLVAGPQFDHWPDHLGDDLACLAQDHRVADQDALALDLVLVVQGRAVHGGAADLHRGHHGKRSDASGPADAHLDVEQPGVDLLGRVLVGDRPARCPAGRAHRTLRHDRVDLHDHAVDLVRRLVPVPGIGVVVDVGPDIGEVGDDLVPVADRQAPRPQPLVPAGLRVRRAFKMAFVARPGR